MGHDITGITRDGKEIRGPYFPRYWFPHYKYLDAQHHNKGVSGDGEYEEVTQERLRRVVNYVEIDLRSAEEGLREMERKIDGFKAKSSELLGVLRAEREGLQSDLLVSAEYIDLKQRYDAYSQQYRSEFNALIERKKRGEITLREVGERREPFRVEVDSLIERILELESPLSEIEKLIADTEPFVRNFSRALERGFDGPNTGVFYMLTSSLDFVKGVPRFIQLREITATPGYMEGESHAHENDNEAASALASYRGRLQEIGIYEELKKFFEQCIAEDAVRIKFS